jgi:DNA-binding FrmR family transcriptional regulator
MEANRLRNIEAQVRNIIYNVEQRPEATDVPRLIRSLRSVVGIKEGERP